MEANDLLQYYATHSVMTDPGEYRHLFDGLPTDIPSFCEVVQGLILHTHWAERYGMQISKERERENSLRKITRQLARIMELDDSPLTVARPLEKRVVGTCRDYSTFLTAFLRHQGVPARARCGFGTYFEPGKSVDHWTCQYWKADEARWVTVDAQIDQFQRNALGITFNTYNMPEGKFLSAGKAWQLCRAGKADPQIFGIFDMWGLWFIAGNLVRDLLSLNKIELLPWDGWGMIEEPKQEELSQRYMEEMDRVAALTLAGDEAFSKIRAFYKNDERLCPSPDWES
ncbi:MAG: transglutaminase domain-containing protein [Dehalococcoidales bacterium]|nr:MAG: transglutaminase domain-containing protein [Dehalococcoidales bacterium]